MGRLLPENQAQKVPKNIADSLVFFNRSADEYKKVKPIPRNSPDCQKTEIAKHRMNYTRSKLRGIQLKNKERSKLRGI